MMPLHLAGEARRSDTMRAMRTHPAKTSRLRPNGQIDRMNRTIELDIACAGAPIGAPAHNRPLSQDALAP
jgi:hypothetical protein